MSGLQRVDPIAQRLIVEAANHGKDFCYCKSTRDLIGREVERTSIQVIGGVVDITESDRRPLVLGDWLAVIGAGALVLFSCWLFFQAVKGVMKSDQGFVRNGVVTAVAGQWSGAGVDGAGAG